MSEQTLADQGIADPCRVRKSAGRSLAAVPQWAPTAALIGTKLPHL
jgi:hypothetical protein